MEDNLYNRLSRRESQIMDIVFELVEATAVDIQNRLPDAPSNSSVRNLLKLMEDKGYLDHRVEKGTFYYRAAIEPEHAQRSALRHVLKIFFRDSIPQVVSALLRERNLSAEEIAELERLIDQARREDN
jgi:predicted transcriptional regulator